MIETVEQIRKVDIISFDAVGQEVAAIRASLESFNIQVRLHFIGNVKHFIYICKRPDYFHEVVILCCHGYKGELLLPVLAPELEVDMPYSKSLTAKDCGEFLQFRNQVVINTGCSLGNSAFAEVMLGKGAAAYIGSTDYNEADATSLFILVLLYFYLAKNLPITLAYEKAKIIDKETSLFNLWLVK